MNGNAIQNGNSALVDLTSSNQGVRHDVVQRIFKQMGIKAKSHDILHDYAGQSRPSVAIEVENPHDRKHSLYAGAYHGLIANEPGQIILHPGHGDDHIHSIRIQGDPTQIGQLFDKHGVKQRSLMPIRDAQGGPEFRVLVFDKGGKYKQNMANLAREINGEVFTKKGTGFFVGGKDQKTAHEHYRHVINKIQNQLVGHHNKRDENGMPEGSLVQKYVRKLKAEQMAREGKPVKKGRAELFNLFMKLIQDDPDNPINYMAFADHLQEQDHPLYHVMQKIAAAKRFPDTHGHMGFISDDRDYEKNSRRYYEKLEENKDKSEIIHGKPLTNGTRRVHAIDSNTSDGYSLPHYVGVNPTSKGEFYVKYTPKKTTDFIDFHTYMSPKEMDQMARTAIRHNEEGSYDERGFYQLDKWSQYIKPDQPEQPKPEQLARSGKPVKKNMHGEYENHENLRGLMNKLVENPEDITTHAMIGDLLLHHGSPLGEHIVREILDRNREGKGLRENYLGYVTDRNPTNEENMADHGPLQVHWDYSLDPKEETPTYHIRFFNKESSGSPTFKYTKSFDRYGFKKFANKLKQSESGSFGGNSGQKILDYLDDNEYDHQQEHNNDPDRIAQIRHEERYRGGSESLDAGERNPSMGRRFSRSGKPVKNSKEESNQEEIAKKLPEYAKIERSQGDGWKITTPHGYIDYVNKPHEDSNEIWWVETTGRKNKGHGSKLVDLMQMAHPSTAIGWGITTPEGKALRDSWHRKNPEINQHNGAFEGQFDPSGDNYGEDNYEDEDYDDEDYEDYEPEQFSRKGKPVKKADFSTNPQQQLNISVPLPQVVPNKQPAAKPAPMPLASQDGNAVNSLQNTNFKESPSNASLILPYYQE